MKKFKILLASTFLAGIAYSATILADVPTSYNMAIQNSYNNKLEDAKANFISKFPSNADYYCPPPTQQVGYHESTTPFTFNVNCKGGYDKTTGPIQMSVAYQLTASDLPKPLTCTVDYTWDGSTCVATIKQSEEAGPAACKITAQTTAGACNYYLEFFNKLSKDSTN